MRANLEERPSPPPSRGGGRDVLIVGHDSAETDLLTTTLELAGYRVAGVAGTGAEGVERIARRRFDLVVWDATLPDLKEVAQGRRIGPEDRPPLLYLITCEYLYTLLPVLGRGREDYVTKPVRTTEVLARAQLLLRGAQREGRPGELGYGDLVLDDTVCEAWRGSRPLDLSPAEYRLLRHLLANAGRVLSKEQIGRYVWGEFRATDAIEKLVSRLRHKVDRGEPALIHTRRGFGYWLGHPRD
ncbi:response regulator transcription factor [Streptomyces sp. NPDC094038]|uniref:response regulator transcription factor n=1 Tax=Streptomyces sp. NPDC094038 TaxID=3366055 RepID=UPI0038295C19